MKVPFKLAALVLMAGTLTACAVGPDYQVPEQVKDVPFSSPYQHSNLALNWWQAFDDQVLNQLIDKALVENRTITQARANVGRAYLDFRDADNNGLPTGTIDSGYQAYENSTLDPSDDDIVTRGYSTGISLSWDIDLFGKIQRASEAAQANLQQADILWHDAQLQIISQVAISYGDYRGAQLRLKVAQENLSNLEQSRAIVLARLDAGMASELELARMDAQLYEVKANIPAYESQLQTADAALSSLLAQRPGQLALDDSKNSLHLKQLPQLQKPVAIVQGENYLRYRADVASSERALAASTAQIGVATADLYPSLSIGGFLGFLSGSGLSLNSSSQSWSVAPTLSWKAADLGSVRARINSAKASSRMALADFEQSVFTALNEMSLSLKNYNLSRQQEIMIAHQREASHKAVRIARQRYNAGSGEFLDLLDAERELLRSRDQQAQLEQQTFTRLVGIYKTFGGGINVL
ncbi:efflux transporter outer membrane subunit [Neptunomonas qingdaonensis]|uniref:Outer membrane protein, multidrug efflux system n=1 Tax=Neptunomonas qingdaonensis TaxID=1045558 RepID=A0A1I2LPD5_9GAMM|nr:TolC family protein [Neptunomonas qingdaonensis]SFF78896.1 outer membrane protein, multidrug efflux system [Neptunomonas qingdaonensis]